MGRIHDARRSPHPNAQSTPPTKISPLGRTSRISATRRSAPGNPFFWPDEGGVGFHHRAIRTDHANWERIVDERVVRLIEEVEQNRWLVPVALGLRPPEDACDPSLECPANHREPRTKRVQWVA
jgi:hypothetical protein